MKRFVKEWMQTFLILCGLILLFAFFIGVPLYISYMQLFDGIGFAVFLIVWALLIVSAIVAIEKDKEE